MNDASHIKVWDIAVRIFHWSLVVLFFVAYFSGDDDSLLHIYAGYGVLALIVFRVVWGLVGRRHARFADFVVGPAATLRYAWSLASGRPLHYLGHNPLGGWMVVALLVSLFPTCWSGQRRSGCRDQRQRGEKDEFWEEVHAVLSDFTLFLLLLHVLGGLLSSWLHRENLTPISPSRRVAMGTPCAAAGLRAVGCSRSGAASSEDLQSLRKIDEQV